MHCALCDLENLPVTNTGICPDCWNSLNTEDVKEQIEIKEEVGKKTSQNKKRKIIFFENH